MLSIIHWVKDVIYRETIFYTHNKQRILWKYLIPWFPNLSTLPCFLVPFGTLFAKFRVNIAVIDFPMFPCGLLVRSCWVEIYHSSSCRRQAFQLWLLKLQENEQTSILARKVVRYGHYSFSRTATLKSQSSCKKVVAQSIWVMPAGLPWLSRSAWRWYMIHIYM